VSWDVATRRAGSELESIAAQVRTWLPVAIVLLAALVAPESRRNGTTQFALSCGVRREVIAAAQFLALSTILVVVIAIVHFGFAVSGMTTGAMSRVDVAAGWVGLLLPLLALALSAFCLSLTASSIEVYLVFLALPFLLQTIPSLIGGLPRAVPRLVARGIDNFSLLLPQADEVMPWPHLSYGPAEGLPAPEWHWPAAHLCAALTFWIVLGLWRYQRHDFGSRTAVK
jgi:ABC-type transport system involved in multi-copper enzyme maturation permease subunit